MGANSLFGWRGAWMLLLLRRGKQNKNTSSLHKQVLLPCSKLRTGVWFEESSAAADAVQTVISFRSVSTVRKQHNHQRRLVSTASSSRIVLKQGLVGAVMFAASLCLLSLLHPDCCLSQPFNHNFPPKKKKKKYLNIFSSLNLKYTSKNFGLIFKSNPKWKRNGKMKKRGENKSEKAHVSIK